MLAAVFGCDQLKFVVYGIAEGDAVVGVPERHAIEEALGVLVGELQGPGVAGVGGF